MLEFESFSTLELIGFVVFVASLFIQLIYYWFIFGRLAFHKSKFNAETDKAVSIVISARNEYENLKNNLPLILDQDYNNFELIVVNHVSDDGTEGLLKEFAYKYDRLKPVHIREDLNAFSGKKFPLSIGIKSAKNDCLLLTDADCKPSSNQWLRQMQDQFDDKTEIVLGYSPYNKSRGILNALIRWDTLHIGIQYLSFALAKIPYMGVGRNLSYRRSLFIKNKGFINHYKVSSGDDDLFIGQVANSKNTKIRVNKESQTTSEPKKSLTSWWKQKRRHLTTGKYYRTKYKVVLGWYSLSQTMFFISFVFMLAISQLYYLILGLFLIRMLSQLFLFIKCMSKLGEKQSWFLIPVYEIVFVVLNPIIAFSNLILKDKKWK
ncbi:MAG: glycosyltransferase [Bacteroidales bacterium]